MHFNLAENRRDPDFPFAFMATYASSLSAAGALRHLPLGQALREYAGDKAKLLQLLAPVQEARETCSWLKTIVDADDIFHPLRWEPADAARFLGDVEAMERAGLVVRMPANWAANRPSRPSVEATVGSTQPSVLGADGLLDFRVEVSLDFRDFWKATNSPIAKDALDQIGALRYRGRDHGQGRPTSQPCATRA